MSRATHSITIANTASVPPTVTVIHVRPSDQEWQITRIEMFSGTYLIADDIELAKLSRSSQDSVIRALNDWQLRRESGMRRLWADLQADAAVERIMDGAVPS